jgi:hypothetical protein
VPLAATNAATAQLFGPLRRCTSLRKLTLGCCDGIKDKDIVSFANASNRTVTWLTLQSCSQITNNSVYALATQVCSPDLETLDLVSHPVQNLNNLTDLSIVSFATECPKIATLRLYMWTLGRRGAEAISSLKSLKYLKLRGVMGLTDAILSPIFAKCSSLVEVHLANTPELTDATAKALALGPGSNLLSLSLTNNGNVTDDFVSTLADSCTSLREIHLNTCARITDASAASLKRMQTLRSIALVNIRLITDAMLVGVLKCHQLEALTLDFCNVTAAGLAPVAKLCPKLTRLSLSFCHEIGVGACHVIATCPALAFLELVRSKSLCPANVMKVLGPT